MYITIGQSSLQLFKKSSKKELLDFLNHEVKDNIILGLDAREEIDFYVITLSNNDIDFWGIGIISDSPFELTILILENNRFLLGYNSKVTCINIDKQKIEFEIPLFTIFYRFIFLEKLNKILIFHEIGVLQIDEKGKIIWEIDTDIITNYKIEDNILDLEFMDSLPIKVSILDGKKIV